MKITIPVTIDVDPDEWRKVMNGDASNRDGRNGYSLASVREDIIEHVFGLIDGTSLVEETGARVTIRGTRFDATKD
jgi:hypothetical protein